MSVRDVELTTHKIREALDLLTRRPWTKQQFNTHFRGSEVLEGLISKGYAELLKGDDKVWLTLSGTRALLDMEGLPYD